MTNNNLICSECGGKVSKSESNLESGFRIFYYKCNQCGATKAEPITEKIDMSKNASLEVIMD